VTIPTVVDDLVEGPEQVRMDVGPLDESDLPAPLELTGTVVD
jgi:hypothetical protein